MSFPHCPQAFPQTTEKDTHVPVVDINGFDTFWQTSHFFALVAFHKRRFMLVKNCS